jgi:hypothetical protein
MAHKIDVEDFPHLDEAAKKRVQEALHKSLQQELERELKQKGQNPTGVFGDGSVKGIQRQLA